MMELQEQLETEKDHSAFLEKLLRIRHGDGWNKLTFSDARKCHERDAALEKRCAELEAEIDSVKGCHNRYDPEMQKLGASEPTSLKVTVQELVAEIGSYWGVELNRRIEVERQRDCLADELDALAVELAERSK